MSDVDENVDEKYKKELKELFEKVSYEVSEKFGLKNKPGIEFSNTDDAMACYSLSDDTIYITDNLLEEYKQGQRLAKIGKEIMEELAKLDKKVPVRLRDTIEKYRDEVKCYARHENVHRVRFKSGYTYSEPPLPVQLDLRVSYEEIKNSYQSQFKNFVKRIVEEAIADLYALADTADEEIIMNRLFNFSYGLKEYGQFYENISNFFDHLLSYMRYLKQISENNRNFIEKPSLDKKEEIYKLKKEAKNVSNTFKKALNINFIDSLLSQSERLIPGYVKAIHPYKNLEYVCFYTFGKDERIIEVGYFLGTLAALGYRHSKNRPKLDELVKEKDPLKLLDKILDLAEKGKAPFKNYIKELYRSKKIPKEYYEKLLECVDDVFKKLPVKKKYYEFLYSFIIVLTIFSYLFFGGRITGFFGTGFSAIIPSILISLIVLYAFFSMLKR